MIRSALALALVLLGWTLFCLFAVLAAVVSMSIGDCAPDVPCHTNDPIGLVVGIGIVVWLAVGYGMIRIWEKHVQGNPDREPEA